MRAQLGFLGASSPVLLEPALRMFEQRSAEEGGSVLPATSDSRVLLTFSATGALYQAALALALREQDSVLIPAYNCGHEIEPLLRGGARVRFYRVRDDLSIDLEDLIAGIDGSTRAVVVTHYFGFPQDVDALRALCNEHGLVLIEDCAHALFSRDGTDLLGSAGELAVFSLRKSLPLPHGGALLCRDPALRVPSALPRPPRLSTLAKRLERYQKGWLMPKRGRPGAGGRSAFLATRLLVDGAKFLRAAADACGRVQFDPDEESFDFPSAPLQWGVASEVEHALRSVPLPEIVRSRRSNFETLLEASDRFAGCTPVFPTLPPGVCPLYFPVRSDEPDALVSRLQRAGISAVQWWGNSHQAVPWHSYPEAAALKQSIVVLPIHQDLSDVHMHWVAEVLTGHDRILGRRALPRGRLDDHT